MASFFDPTYDPRQDAASSGVEVTDLNPERIYDTDLRRVDEEDRSTVEPINDKQGRVAKFMRAAKSAGAYRQRAGIAEPTIRGPGIQPSLMERNYQVWETGWAEEEARTMPTNLSRDPVVLSTNQTWENTISGG